VDDTRGGRPRDAYLSTVDSGPCLPALLLLVGEVDLVFCVVVARWTAYDSNAALAGHHLDIAAALHRLLNALRRDAFLEQLVRDAVELVLLAEARHIKQLLLAATVPVHFRLHLVADRAAIDDWGSVWRPTSHLILNLLHIKAVFVADLLVESRRRGAIARIMFDDGLLGATSYCFTTSTALLLVVGILLSPIGNRLSRATCVVLRGRQVHLILLGATRLDHTGRLPDNLLVGH